MYGKLGTQGFHYDTKELFEPIIKALEDNNQKLLEETKSTTKEIEEMDESNFHVKPSEILNRNGVILSSLIRPTAKLLVPTNRSQFWLNDELNSDIWKDFVVNGEKLQYMMIS